MASVREADQRHEVSRKCLLQFAPHEASCAAHSLAELYAALTGMKPPNRIRPEMAELLLEHFKTSLHFISLTADEVLQTIHRTVALKLPGGIIYDALVLACARKIIAERIYTWNVKHFQMVAPDMVERIMTP
jgi:predicted nucleic acid-binding protein